jgi:hypothetical protein
LKPLLHCPKVLKFSAEIGYFGLSNRTVQF